MKIKSVIVDDEKIAREVLRNYLTKYCPQIEILGEAENIKEAVPLIAEHQPQLVFLNRYPLDFHYFRNNDLHL